MMNLTYFLITGVMMINKHKIVFNNNVSPYKKCRTFMFEKVQAKCGLEYSEDIMRLSN